MHIVAFGTFRSDLHPRVSALVAGLRARGVSVETINEPLPLDTSQRVAVLQRPWRLPWLAVALLRCWWRLLRRATAARGRRRPDAVLVGYLGHFDIHLARLAFPRVPIVLDHLVFGADTATDRGSRGRVLLRILAAVDSLALRRGSVVVLDTEEHRALAAPRSRGRCVVVPVGATDEWFDVPPRAPRTEAASPLRVVFFGLFTPLQGTPVIAEAIRLLPRELDIRVTLVGKGQDHAVVRRCVTGDERVRLVDWLAAPALVDEVAASDVVLGVFGRGAKAQRVVPTKVYQGLAAGRVVVTSDTAPQRRALEDAALLVPPGDPPALAEALTSLARDPALVDRLAVAARARASERFTAAASVAELTAALGIPDAGPADRTPGEAPPSPGTWPEGSSRSTVS